MPDTEPAHGQPVSAQGREWLRSGCPRQLAGFDFHEAKPWPILVGGICDLATVPAALGLEMLGFAARMPDFRIGPTFGNARQVTFCLRSSSGVGLLGVLLCTQGAPGGVLVAQAGRIVPTPPPCGARGPDGSVWLMPPDASPHLPGTGTFAYLASLAARSRHLVAVRDHPQPTGHANGHT